jgi:catechol 2,3-dioxygenase-like lactoylglutathione lyase family enzyme
VRVHHLALRAEDVLRTTAFYRDELGLLELDQRVDDAGSLRSIWLDADGVVVMIERRAPSEPSIPEGTMELVAFEVTPERFESLRETLSFIEHSTEYTLYTRDPDGRRVGLSKYRFAHHARR